MHFENALKSPRLWRNIKSLTAYPEVIRFCRNERTAGNASSLAVSLAQVDFPVCLSLYFTAFLQDLKSHEKEGDLQFDTVDEDDACIVAAADAVKIVVKDPLFAVLEKDPGITHSPGNLGGSCLHDNAASPGFKFLVKHPVSNVEVGMLSGRPFC